MLVIPNKHNIAQKTIIDKLHLVFFYKKQLIFMKYTANLTPVYLKPACIFVFLSQGDIAYPCFSFKKGIKADHGVRKRYI